MAPGAAKRVVYLDTCAVIEAHRTRCWKALAARHDLHTVGAERGRAAHPNIGAETGKSLHAAFRGVNLTYPCESAFIRGSKTFPCRAGHRVTAAATSGGQAPLQPRLVWSQEMEGGVTRRRHGERTG